MKLDFKITPGTVVFLSALAIIVLSRVVPYVIGQRISTVDPRISITTAAASERTSEQPKYQKYQPSTAAVVNGQVARTEERLREASALAVAASLYIVREHTQGRAVARTVDDLLAGIAQANLLPPGLTLNSQSGTLTSAYGSLFVRYRPMPLGVEVVALGRARADGAGLIVRVPNDGTSKDSAAVYMATRIEDMVIPPSFVPAAEVIAYGWSPEPLQATRLQ